MTDSLVRPLGHFVLVQDEKVENVSKGGIVLSSDNQAVREQEGVQMGRIVSFGPLAYKHFKGCTCPADWGVAVGDLVEYTGSYEGKKSAFYKTGASSDTDVVWRVVPDSSLVSAKIED